MALAHVHVARLYAALDERRQAADLSWRQLAKNLDLSPSLMSRLANGLRPDVDAFTTLLQWLNMPAEAFVVTDNSSESSRPPEIMASISPLLRASTEFKPHEIEYLEEVFRATIRHVRSGKKPE